MITIHTQKYKDQNNGGKSSDYVEHRMQSSADLINFFVLLHQHRREEETNCYTQLEIKTIILNFS